VNWEAISTISEVIGAIAVVVSLIYLAVQVKQNTKLMRATAKQSLTEASQGMIYKMSEHPDLWVKLMSGTDPSSPEEDAQMSLLMRAMYRGFESQCYQHEAGLIEEPEWQALSNSIIQLTAMPGINRYWQQLKPHMSERLQRIIDGSSE